MVMVDDKLRVLTAMKELWRRGLTTMFSREGHYALDRNDTDTYPRADINC